MKISNGFAFLTLSTLFLLQSCQPDDDIPVATFDQPQVTTGYANVPVALWDYFERFETEAADRGLLIDLVALDISAEIAEIPEDHVAGTCTYGHNHPGHIVIDKPFWEQAPENWKEMIIFHELGHCVLHRDHRDGAYSNGACLSIMRSGLGNCIDNYHQATREFYLDELYGFEM